MMLTLHGSGCRGLRRRRVRRAKVRRPAATRVQAVGYHRLVRAVLARVGIDQAYGGWNGPVDPVTREFGCVPIPDEAGVRMTERRMPAGGSPTRWG